MADISHDNLLQEMAATRAATLKLFDLAAEAVLHDSPGFGYRPLMWHLAHIGVYEGYWILQQILQEPPLNEEYYAIFDPIHTPRAQSKNLPSRAAMEDFLRRVRERVATAIAELNFNSDKPLLRDGYAVRLILEHEQQHQETLAYLLHLLAPAQKNSPPQPALPIPRQVAAPGTMMEIPAGSFLMGTSGAGFAYDNEGPSQEVFVPAFRLDVNLTTNVEYAAFIADGGYTRRALWSPEGWECRLQQDWYAPLYWRKTGTDWREQTMFAESALRATHPVSGISFYEAEAYAKWRGARLPTEAEWEKAATWDATTGRKRLYAWGDAPPDDTCGNFGMRLWSTTPVGSYPAAAGPYGCLDMAGNVWEWTATPFDAYPGFAPFPYPEYSQLWFDGDHRVLRGGSWATQPRILRATFRNFFRRPFRIAFAGLRCAADG